MGSDGSPYEKRMDTKGRVLSEKCIAGAMPFEELPEGWAWARLENLCSVITDGDHQAPPQQADGVPFLVISDVSSGELDFSNTRHVSIDYFNSLEDSRRPCRGDLLLTVTGSFGIPVPVDTEENFCFQRHIALLRPLSCRPFMTNILLAPSTYKYFKAKATGTAQKTVSLSCLRSTLLALPPESEQQRIVGKLAQLMPLVEDYGKLEDAREELDAALPERLRKSILQMAVQGKLVPQDSADEPASVLLKRIREQRRKMIAEKKMKAPKGGESVIFRGSDGRRYEKRIDAKGRESEPACVEDEIPFDIPDSWEWVRLESLIVLLSGTDLKPTQYNDKNEGIPYLTGASNFVNGELVENRWTAEPTRISTKGELLFTCKGTVGEMAINRFDAAHIARQIMAITPCEYEMLPYITLLLKAMVEDIKSHAKGVIPGIERNTLLARLIPVPPLAEQNRIAEKSAELFSEIA